MTTVLIADSCKPSLVMTSEVFKDKIMGTVVDVAATGKEALDYLTARRPDLCVVDFDLPDVDGPALVEAMRKVYD
ncbi:MAG: response regulator, partial [Pseudobdellovibrionaceae bacterium]|nr:response regulator [Pseudobdellovibrionaceae bacterium]